MYIEDIKRIVTNSQNKKFRVVKRDGSTEIIRLFKADDGRIAFMPKGNKTWGRELPHYRILEWETIKPIQQRESDVAKRFKKRCIAAIGYLNESGLWGDIKEMLEFLVEHDEIIAEVCEDFKNGVMYDKLTKGKHKEWCTCYQVIESFCVKNCWKSIRWHKYYRETDKARLTRSIKNRSNDRCSWRNGYDCSFETDFENGNDRAWYNEEYINCGNGWYYLLFDDKHAIYYEKD